MSRGRKDVAKGVDTAGGRGKSMRCLWSAKPDGSQVLDCVQCSPFPSWEVNKMQLFKFSLATWFDDSHYGSLTSMTNVSCPKPTYKRPATKKMKLQENSVEEAFMRREIARRSAGKAKIRKIAVQGKRLLFYVTGWRYCEHIQREHTSNNIYFVLDTLTNKYYQRCLDSDCEYFSGKQYPCGSLRASCT